jgi:DNA repair protein RadA/Sms
MKAKKIFTCQKCGGQSAKWLGRCPECGEWNSFVEETYTTVPAGMAAEEASGGKGMTALRASLAVQSNMTLGAADGLEVIPAWGGAKKVSHSKPKKLAEISTDQTERNPTNYSELDRVLGGGVVGGSLVLIGGDPGIGKSTILMQALAGLGSKVLYVSGEESAQQIKIRAERLDISDDDFYILAENALETIIENIKKLKPNILIIDSIQTIFTNAVASAPGSVSQIRECCGKLMIVAKTLGVATFVVGHITKEGSIAGPKVLEHMVDTVLYFENSSSHTYRILRAVKNRFGSTNEIGVFEMVQGGLKEVSNPSELFLQERPQNSTGSVVVSAIEGSRPILVEVQALVSASNLSMPRRTTLGVESSRVSMLVAVIEKKLDMPLYGHDIFVNVVGGIDLREPSCDLGIVAALLSSYKNVPLSPKLLVCGEVGLAGEVRHVSQIEHRLTEARKLGFDTVVLPQASIDKLDPQAKDLLKGITLQGVRTIQQACDVIFS